MANCCRTLRCHIWLLRPYGVLRYPEFKDHGYRVPFFFLRPCSTFYQAPPTTVVHQECNKNFQRQSWVVKFSKERLHASSTLDESRYCSNDDHTAVKLRFGEIGGRIHTVEHPQCERPPSSNRKKHCKLRYCRRFHRGKTGYHCNGISFEGSRKWFWIAQFFKCPPP